MLRSAGTDVSKALRLGGLSEKAREARIRNWNIRRLRGLYAFSFCSFLSVDEAAQLRAVADQALERMGAESETAQRTRMRLERILGDG
jgi:hypothetical protein